MPAIIFLLGIFTIFVFVKTIRMLYDGNTYIGKFLLFALGYTILLISFFGGFFTGMFFWLIWLLGGCLGGYLVELANDMKSEKKSTDVDSWKLEIVDYTKEAKRHQDLYKSWSRK